MLKVESCPQRMPVMNALPERRNAKWTPVPLSASSANDCLYHAPKRDVKGGLDDPPTPDPQALEVSLASSMQIET